MGKGELKKIAGAVILYNPEAKAYDNIKSYIDYLDKLFVIDNSEYQNNSMIERLKKEYKVSYYYNSQNVGIAGGLNIALKEAIKNKYQFILTMDQDSCFEEDYLGILLNEVEPEKNIGIYSPFHKNKFFTKKPKSSEPEEVSDVMTSGNILNLRAVQEIGFFKEDYFIDYVDIEYCFRLRKNGYKIFRINNSFLTHNEANLTKKNFFGLTVYPPVHVSLRWYYKIRNYF